MCTICVQEPKEIRRGHWIIAVTRVCELLCSLEAKLRLSAPNHWVSSTGSSPSNYELAH